MAYDNVKVEKRVKQLGLDYASLYEEICARFQAARDHSRDWRVEARDSYDFVAGEQWTPEDRAYLTAEQRPIIVFNRCAPMIDSVVGQEINNRQETRYFPRESGDAQVSEILTGAAAWVRDSCEAEDEESDAFQDLCIAGMGWTETRMDYLHDEEGMPVINRVDPLEMYWDPAARRRNLADARYVCRWKQVDRQTFKYLFPDADVPIELGKWMGGADWDLDVDLLPHDASRAWEYGQHHDPNGGGMRHDDKLIPILEYCWCDYEDVWRLPDPSDPKKIITLAETEIKQVLDQVNEQADQQLRSQGQEPTHGPAVTREVLLMQAVKAQRKRLLKAFVAGDCIVECDLAASQVEWTYQALTAKRDRNKNAWYGLVRAMKDPQRWSNKFFSQILHIINSNAKGGALAEVDAFANPQQATDEWARPDSITFTNPGALQNGKIIPKPIGQVPPALENMMGLAINAVRDTSGINLELLGMANRQQSGTLEFQRKQQGLTILAGLFDALRLYRKRQGRVLLDFIQKYVSDGRLIRIMGKDGNPKYVPLALDDKAAVYDVVIDESPTSPNQKERTWEIMSQMVPFLIPAGVPIPPSILRSTPLPTHLVEEWMKYIEEKDKPDPMLQQMKQLELQERQAKIGKLSAEAEAERASAMLDMVKAQAEGGQIELDQAQAMIDAIGKRLDHVAKMAAVEVQKEQISGQRQKSVMEAQTKAVDIAARLQDMSLRRQEARQKANGAAK